MCLYLGPAIKPEEALNAHFLYELQHYGMSILMVFLMHWCIFFLEMDIWFSFMKKESLLFTNYLIESNVLLKNFDATFCVNPLYLIYASKLTHCSSVKWFGKVQLC